MHTVAGLDRNNRIIVLDASSRWPNIFDDLEDAGIVDLSQGVIMDPVNQDFFTRKLTEALRAIGNPPLAGNNPLVRRATGQVGRGANRTAHTSTADFLWNLAAMAGAAVQRNLAPVRQALETGGQTLDQGQWRAWEEALSRRARLVWGPPGTGKSQTVRAILAGAILDAAQAGRACRVLLTATTYTAIDNVLLDVGRDVEAHNLTNCRVFRLRSKYQGDPGTIAPTIDLEINKADPSQEVQDLRDLLTNANELVIVGATPEQVFNLLTCNDGEPQAEWFDLIVVDEASQMDVAHAILPLCAVASGGSVVLAGDKLQLPPIHQAEPPLNLEHMVGPIYSFFESEGVGVSALDTNYRSNETIVSFARMAGYRSSLSSFAPNLALQFRQALPTTQPANWPPTLVWTPEWNLLLDPNVPAVCFVYIDGRSSQRNIFEANAVASLTYILHENLSNALRNDTNPPQSWQFWTHGVGIVTPHRAQQGLITSRLQEVFNATGQTADAIRSAVDTVERFQGQQRDVIIASYTLGDPDQIAEEEEFLMSLNRFNVIASRARAKLIVLISQEVVSHLAGEIDVLRESRLLKVYAESFCNRHRDISLV